MDGALAFTIDFDHGAADRGRNVDGMGLFGYPTGGKFFSTVFARSSSERDTSTAALAEN